MARIEAGEVVRRYQERRQSRAPELRRAQEVRDAVNGDIALPLPELNRNEKAAVANLMRLTVNQNSTRLASTLPTLWCPPTRPGVQRAERDADLRRKVMYGWWRMNEFKTLQYRRARHFTAYASSPVYIRPEYQTERNPRGRNIPVWEVKNPLSTFPAPTVTADAVDPPDCIFDTLVSWKWLTTTYPAQAAQLARSDERPDSMFHLLQYVDHEQHALVVLGRDGAYDHHIVWNTRPQGARYTTLEWLPNRAGICTAVVPGRISLDRPQGQYDGMLNLFVKRARLAALEEIAIEKGVFENEWFVEDMQGGEIVTEADGRLGVVGHVRGGQITWHTQNPGYKTDQALDRLERQERLEGPMPAEYGAESASNVRTDRRGNTILSAAIEFSHAEAHDVFAKSYRHELVVAVAVDTGCFGDLTKSFYVNWKGASGPVKYTPNKLWAESDEVVVRWSMPGSDVNGLTVAGGQRVGMGTLSKRGFMEIDPLVDDVEEEHDRITAEALETALLQSIQQQAATGAIPPSDMARIMELVVTNKASLADAVTQVQREAQERQAAQAPPGAPETMPGLSMPGMGAEAGVEPTMGPTEDQQGLAQLVRSLRAPQAAA